MTEHTVHQFTEKDVERMDHSVYGVHYRDADTGERVCPTRVEFAVEYGHMVYHAPESPKPSRWRRLIKVLTGGRL